MLSSVASSGVIMPKQVAMTAGNRTTRVEFQKNTPTTNTDGQSVDSWSTQFFRWVSLQARGGRESFLFMQLGADISHILNCDYTPELAAAVPSLWRAKIGSRILNIGAIIDQDGNRKALRILATESLP
jgi:SPP1 family predicted phage head-tail adaptor